MTTRQLKKPQVDVSNQTVSLEHRISTFTGLSRCN